MDKKRYNQVRAAVAAGIGIVMAYSVMRSSWALAMVSVLLAMAVLYAAKQRVDEVLYDERTRLIREKAATTTLGIVTVAMAAGGLLLVEASFRGYTAYRDLGYLLAFAANVILGVNAFFNWYYKNQMGG